MANPAPTISLNFGGLGGDDSLWNHCRVVILPVPYDLTSTYLSGSRRGPLAILEASTHLELFDEELQLETARIGLHTLESLEALASGPEDMIRRIQDHAKRVIQGQKFPVLLGGEHTVTLGMIPHLQERHPKLSFLQLDAHADLRDRYEGTPFSHACVGRRLAERGPLVQVGLRSLSQEESDFLKQTSVRHFFWHEWRDRPEWEDRAIQALTEEVYVTIDLDVLDPAIMPAVGTPEPGGMDWTTLIHFLGQVARRRKIVGFDVVELTPIPGLIAPDFLAAKLIYRFLGYIFKSALLTDRMKNQ
jgi:agmatinase